MLDVAVVLVTWNVHDLVLNALDSLFADLENSNLQFAVYVVDSASSDGTGEAIEAAFPQVELIISPDNLGFGKANNVALRQLGFDGSIYQDALPKVVYLLNPDTVTQPDATRTLYDALMADTNIGMVGARLSYEDGSFQHSAFMFPGLKQIWAEFLPTPGRWIEGQFNGRYPPEQYVGDKPFAVDFMLGATMMLRREVILQTGMFDEAFFMYCEEIDWAWRIRKAGWNIHCVPQAHLIHLSGQSTSQVRPRSVVNLWTSRLKLYDKHYPVWKVRLARCLIAVGMRRKMQRLAPETEAYTDILHAYQTIHDMAIGA